MNNNLNNIEIEENENVYENDEHDESPLIHNFEEAESIENYSDNGCNNEGGPISQSRCPICFENFTNPVVTLCGHCYCFDCLRNSLKYSCKCPLCERSIDLDKVITVYNVGNADENASDRPFHNIPPEQTSQNNDNQRSHFTTYTSFSWPFGFYRTQYRSDRNYTDEEIRRMSRQRIFFVVIIVIILIFLQFMLPNTSSFTFYTFGPF
eukprot:TRINITY_DN1869_c0_g1_i1.p1 TRINITY_DN1869_c0_g1~~TRINITY_DN1869_c0_g1_i1.p1  ORF type:complete len:208 (+),score=45.36 TRINITY_DN1869_c0_g1_i1:425-1048(+)